MMTRSADTGQERAAADASADMRRLASDMLNNPSGMPIHPFMAHPAAAIAAATAIGFSLSSQMAGAFFGALQGAVAASNRFAAAIDEHGGSIAEPIVEVSTKAQATVDDNPMPPAVKPEAVKIKKAKTAVKAATIVEARPPVVMLEEKQPALRSRKVAAKVDDLKRISGIGPKLAQVLNERGVRRFADIASWSEADVVRIDAELGFDGRIRRDDWVGQAKALMSKRAGAR